MKAAIKIHPTEVMVSNLAIMLRPFGLQWLLSTVLIADKKKPTDMTHTLCNIFYFMQ
jgi:hypothetical protein